jgi:hypothetical protein
VEWGKKEGGTVETFEFKKDTKAICSIGFRSNNFIVQQVVFYDDAKKEIVRCGASTEELKTKELQQGSKIVYAYGANSIDTKNIGMLGFTLYNPI